MKTNAPLVPNPLMRDLASLAIILGGIAAVYNMYCNYHRLQIDKIRLKELEVAQLNN